MRGLFGAVYIPERFANAVEPGSDDKLGKRQESAAAAFRAAAFLHFVPCVADADGNCSGPGAEACGTWQCLSWTISAHRRAPVLR